MFMDSGERKIQAGLFNFNPAVRPVPITVHIKGFQGAHYCPRMTLMNKPAFKGQSGETTMSECVAKDVRKKEII